MRIAVENGLAGTALASELQAVTVVVDALRASANVASMFHHGTEELLVVREVEEAFAEKARRPHAILSGERGGPAVPGFDRGNSPLQAPPDLDIRQVIFSSSNCSRCCVGVVQTPAAFLGSTVNATATAARVTGACKRLGREAVVLVLAGSVLDEVRLTIEDHLAAGAIVAALSAAGADVQIANDRAEVCRRLYAPLDQEGLIAGFLQSDNGRELASLGLGADVVFAARLDVFDVVPRIAAKVELIGGGDGALVVGE